MMMASLSSSVGLFGSPTKMITMSVSSLSSTSRKNVHLHKRCSLKVNAHPSKIYRDSDMSKMQVGVNKLVGGLLGPKRHLVLMSSKDGSPKTVNNAIKEVEDRDNKYEEIGNMVDEAFSKVGREGEVVTLKGGKHAKDDGLYLAEGMHFDPGLLSPYLVTNREEMFFFDNENCKLLLVDKITNAKDLASVLKDAIKGGYPILIITSAWDDQREALDAFVASRPLGAPKIAVLKSHGFGWGNYLDDVAVLTGATVIREKAGLTLENVESEVLGFAAKVVVAADGGTTIVGDGTTKESLNRAAEKIRELVSAKETALKIPAESIKEIFQEARLNHQIEWLNARLVRLSERVAVIEVGAETEKEVEEKKQRFDVAINKIKMAFKESIVARGKFEGVDYDDKLATKMYEDLTLTGVVKPTRVWENPLMELRCVAKIVESHLRDFDYVIAQRSFNSIKDIDDLLFQLDTFTSNLMNSDDVTAERLLGSINDVNDLLVMIDA